MRGAALRDRLRRYRQIERLRRDGLAVAWSAELQWDREATLRFGRGCRIGRHSMVSIVRSDSGGSPGELILGDHVQVGEYNNIRPGECKVTFGSRVLLAQFVSIIGSNHLVRTDGSIAWDEIDTDKRDVEIGDDCWIGAGALILPGVKLGAKTVVGAGAVVTRSSPGGTKLVGSPARPL